MKQYLKFAAQVIATVAVALVAALADDVINTDEIFNIILIALGSLAVLGAGNFPDGVWSYMKGYISAATTAAMFLSSAYTGGISTSEWIQLALAVAGTIGVVALPGPTVQPARPAVRPV